MAIRLGDKDWDALVKKNPNMNTTPLSDKPTLPFTDGTVSPVEQGNVALLRQNLKQIDDMVKDKIITEEQGKDWKQRLIDDFGSKVIPAAIEKKLPNDVSHLPGRIIAGGVDALKAIARGSGATYEGLSRQEGYDPRTGNKLLSSVSRGRGTPQTQQKRAKSPQELMDDLPDIYK